jgi:hypothetical protein
MNHENHPRYNEALTLAASHFLSSTGDLSGEQIILALEGDDEEFKKSRIKLWDALRLDREEVAELISILAEDFINFLDKA